MVEPAPARSNGSRAGPGGRTRREQRILLVTASARRRGAEIQATQLADRLRALGSGVRIVALSAGTDGTPLPIRSLGRWRLGPGTLWKLRSEARMSDVVVAYGSTGLPACVFGLAGSGIPIVYRSVSDPTHWLRGPLHRAVTGWQYRRADRVVALWPAAAQSVIDVLRVPPDRVSVIANARDPLTFRRPSSSERDAARERLGQDDRPLIAFVGSLSPEKRIDLAISTIAELAGHRLLVVGGGPSAAAARAEVARRGLHDRVSFLGELTDIAPILHAADAVLMTSTVEGMPGVAIEAALSGVPVVATPVGALPTMPGVDVVDPVPAALAAGIRRALGASPVDEAEVAGYTWPVVAESWRTLLASVH